MELKKVYQQDQLREVFPLLQELRPHLKLEEFLTIYEMAQVRDQYEIVVAYEEGHAVAMMGYRILFDFVHGKHLYIDDLVVSEKSRSLGLGGKLLLFAEEAAQSHECTGLRLCTGINNERAKSFYQKNNWQLRAVVYKKKL